MRNLDAPLRDGKPIRVERAAPVSLQAYATLRHAFVTLRLRVGQSLSEQGIAQQLRTSRTPVCEAFIKLADAGLSEVLPQRGTFVRKISLKAVRDARFVREAPNGIPRPFGHKVGSLDAAVSLSVEGP
jgi:DNA-binding GntR family transcriptional regulator